MNEDKNRFERNSVDMDFVDLNSIKEEPIIEGNPLTEDNNLNSPLEEQINNEISEGLEEPEKKEIHIEPIKSIAREKDRKINKIIIGVLVGIALIFLFILIKSSISSKYDLFVRNVKNAAKVYIQDDTNASYVSALYNEKIEKIDVTLSELKKRGFITFELKDPRDDSDLSLTKVRISIEDGNLIYTYPVE